MRQRSLHNSGGRTTLGKEVMKRYPRSDYGLCHCLPEARFVQPRDSEACETSETSESSVGWCAWCFQVRLAAYSRKGVPSVGREPHNQNTWARIRVVHADLASNLFQSPCRSESSKDPALYRCLLRYFWHIHSCPSGRHPSLTPRRPGTVMCQVVGYKLWPPKPTQQADYIGQGGN